MFSPIRVLHSDQQVSWIWESESGSKYFIWELVFKLLLGSAGFIYNSKMVCIVNFHKHSWPLPNSITLKHVDMSDEWAVIGLWTNPSNWPCLSLQTSYSILSLLFCMFILLLQLGDISHMSCSVHLLNTRFQWKTINKIGLLGIVFVHENWRPTWGSTWITLCMIVVSCTLQQLISI